MSHYSGYIAYNNCVMKSNTVSIFVVISTAKMADDKAELSLPESLDS